MNPVDSIPIYVLSVIVAHALMIVVAVVNDVIYDKSLTELVVRSFLWPLVVARWVVVNFLRIAIDIIRRG